MIKYNLKCHNNHEFESWFSDSNEFEKLNKKKLLECIFCNSKKISKSIMSPMISVTNDNKDQLEKDNNILKIEKNSLLQIRQYIEKNFEYVGADFGKKVREIYYDRNSKKRIYGTTTPEEREELSEEGIDLISIPWVNKDN
ncbi:MAG: DUF1178 family protein [Pseudomonadota bacterium]|nr:DUF1178 family protein [Pseudomonadota bacterium]|tara:strand:- start:1204 stop:1626 length:423 start_codon:yes stop_codon:yes gene_type:complete